MGGTQGVVGSAETGSPSRGTLASLREASTSPLPADARLGSPSHRSHSPSPPPPAAELLSLRRDYHRAATRAVMAGHHLEYLNAASVPRGLQLTLSPQVYAADTSSVDSVSKILATAQSNVISALCKHYSSLQATSTTKKQTVLAKMSSLLSPSSPLSPTEIEDHKEIMRKTDNNLKKKMDTLADRCP